MKVKELRRLLFEMEDQELDVKVDVDGMICNVESVIEYVPNWPKEPFPESVLIINSNSSLELRNLE